MPNASNTATVSICVTPGERDDIRRAAVMTDATVSSWLARRVGATLASGKSRAQVKALAPKIILPQGTRTARVSTILQKPLHLELGATAGAAGISVHDYLQALAVGSAASAKLGATAEALRAADETLATRKAPAGGAVTALLPESLATADRVGLAALIQAALNQVGDAVFAGQGQVIHDGMTRYHARLEAAGEATVEIRLPIPEIEAQIAARCLKLPVETVMTVLATKAARTMGK